MIQSKLRTVLLPAHSTELQRELFQDLSAAVFLQFLKVFLAKTFLIPDASTFRTYEQAIEQSKRNRRY